MRYAKSSKSAVADKLPQIIFVEGMDDAYFVDALLGELGADPSNVGVIYVEGQSNLAPELKLLLKSGSYVRRETRSIALIRDADADPAAKLQTIHGDLAQLGLPTPAHNEILSYDLDRRLGLFLIPAGDQAGELEHLMLSSVAGDDRVDVVAAALQQVETQYGELDKRQKRIARMYISVLPVKPCGVGRAYCEGVFSSLSPQVQPIRTFLQTFIQ
jgi:hypothetical protein